MTMPYKDPEEKLKAMKRWRENVMPRGYGKWLYQRRKLRFDDADRFRFALEQIQVTEGISDAHNIARDALEQSRKMETALGKFKGKE
jgi:hypothetical protein